MTENKTEILNKLNQNLEEACLLSDPRDKKAKQITLCHMLLDVYDKAPGFFDIEFAESSPQFLTSFKQWYITLLTLKGQ